MTYMAHWFSERMEQLCKELGMTKSRLGQEAGLSHATIGKWMQSAEAGRFSPRLKEVELLSKYTGRPVSWFMTEGGDDGATSKVAVTTISAADLEKVARRLTEFDGVSPNDAWLLMRNLVATDAESLYFAARDVLRSQALEEQHRDGVSEMTRGAMPVRRVKTR